MNFKQYLAELNTEMGQMIKATDSIGITDPQVREKINQRLNHELTDLILSPESGIQKVRKVLMSFGLDMPALYGAEPEGDELVLDVESMVGDEQFYLYLIYYLADDGRYDFYAELTDDEGLNEIMSDEEEDEEEE
jgi:hypothetical protein